MARKKALPINNLGNEDKLTVQKSRPLFSLWQSNLTLAEFKILDTYLGRIDSHNPDRRIVTFEKGELEEKLGVTKISKNNLEARLKNLMGHVIKVTDDDEKNGFKLITLFEEAEAEQDEYGQWKVNLECTQKAMKYIFNIENLGYFQYKLRCITSITSRYTYIMFCYLESHRKMGLSWEVSIEELKKILNCDKEESYNQFKVFNDRILKRVQKELHDKTECCFEYKTIKKGRYVKAISFTLKPITENIDQEKDPGQITFDDITQINDRDSICYGFSDSEFESFSNEQLLLLKDLAWSNRDQADFDRHMEALKDHNMAVQYAVADYLRQKIKMAKLNAPRNLFSYVKKIVENDKKDIES